MTLCATRGIPIGHEGLGGGSAVCRGGATGFGARARPPTATTLFGDGFRREFLPEQDGRELVDKVGLESMMLVD